MGVFDPVFAAFVTLSVAVSGAGAPALPATAPERKLVLCATVPIHALAARVADGVGSVSVELLLDPLVGCPHDYALTPRDRQRIAEASLVLANGLGLDTYLPRPGTGIPPLVEVTAGCELLRGAACGSHEDHAGHAHEEGSANPHVWMSPREAARMTRNIGEALAKLDPGHQERYRAQAGQYAERLEALGQEFAKAADRLRGAKVVATAGVFDYLARDLKLEIVAVVEAHGAEASSPRAIAAAIEAVAQRGARAVLFERGSQERVSETVARNAKVPAAGLGSLTRYEQLPTAPDWYEAQLRANLAAVEKVLEGR